MQPFPPALDEPSNGAFLGQRFQQLQSSLPYLDQGGPHSLVGQFFHLGWWGSKHLLKHLQGRVNILDGHSYVINVVDGAGFGHDGSPSGWFN